MLDWLLSAGAAALSGGATGIIGTVISKAFGFFEDKQSHQHKVELKRLELEELKAMAQAEQASAETRQEWQALRASYKEAATRLSSGQSKALVYVDVVRGLTRPVLTLLFLVLTGAIFFTLVPPVLETESMLAIGDRIIDTVLYLTGLTVSWWFGTRTPKRRESAGG